MVKARTVWESYRWSMAREGVSRVIRRGYLALQGRTGRPAVDQDRLSLNRHEVSEFLRAPCH